MRSFYLQTKYQKWISVSDKYYLDFFSWLVFIGHTCKYGILNLISLIINKQKLQKVWKYIHWDESNKIPHDYIFSLNINHKR